jgi:drug/metabolite transporter (DMT)-like permease
VDYVRGHLGSVPTVVAARLGRTLDLYGLHNLVAQDVGEERPRWASWAGIVSFWLMAVAAPFGALRLRRRERWLLLLPVLMVLCTTVLFYGAHRIRSSAEPTLVLLTALALARSLPALRRSRGPAVTPPPAA